MAGIITDARDFEALPNLCIEKRSTPGIIEPESGLELFATPLRGPRSVARRCKCVSGPKCALACLRLEERGVTAVVVDVVAIIAKSGALLDDVPVLHAHTVATGALQV